MEKIDLKTCLLEFIGTFIIIYIGGWSVQWNYTRIVDLVAASLAQGLVLATMIYIAHPISHSHFNPTVTLVSFLTGHLSAWSLLLYITSQSIASVLAGLSLKLQSRDMWHGEVKNQLGYPMVTQNTSVVSAFFAEMISSFILVFAVYALYYHRKASAGISAAVIGATYIFNSLSIGNMTGCSLNFVRVFGPSFFGMGFMKPRGEWIYYIAPTVGGVLGGFLYHIVFLEEDDPEWKDESSPKLDKIE